MTNDNHGFATPRVLVAQLGARRHYAIPRALWHKGLLSVLVTDACADASPWSFVRRVIPRKCMPTQLQRILQRSTEDIPSSHIENQTAFFLSPSQRRGTRERPCDYWARRNASFGRAVVQRGFGEANTVYTFNGASLEILNAAKERGLRTVVDQTAAALRWNTKILREEQSSWPNWETSIAEVDESGILTEREEMEWRLADLIITGSDFAKSTVAEAGGPSDRVITLRYPLRRTQGRCRSFPPSYNNSRRLRVLFVGTLQLRKGIQYLSLAAEELKDEPVEFRVVGPSSLSVDAQKTLCRRMTLTGPVPREQVAQSYGWADVFVLPTLSEGSANVCYEAVAAGLPVITTRNAGADLVDGVSCIFVEPRDHMMLAGALRRVLRNPEILADLAEGAGRRLGEVSPYVYAEQLYDSLVMESAAKLVI